MKKMGIAIMLTAAVAMAGIAYAYTRTIANTGNISMVQTYNDAALTSICDKIEWGSIVPADQPVTQTKTLYLKNYGPTTVTVTLTTTNWNPAAAAGYMKLSWNRQSATIESGLALDAIVTLTVYPNITGISTFAFDSQINGAYA